MSTLPCLRCGKELKSAIPRPVQDDMPVWQHENQPSAGTTFTSYGQYGSTVWDPDGGWPREFLEINVCDECVLHAAGEGRILRGTKQVRPKPVMTQWMVPELTWCERCGRAVPTSDHERHDDETPWD